MYEGVTLDCGLKVKNGIVVTEPDIDAIKQSSLELIARINAGPQPARKARERAAEEARMKRRK